MSNVLIDREKIDILANAISCKSGEPVTMTLDEMVSAVDGIQTGGGAPTLEMVTKTYTPSTSAVTDTITPSSGYDGIEEVDVTVSAIPLADFSPTSVGSFVTESGAKKWRARGGGYAETAGWIDEGGVEVTQDYSAVPSNTTVTPTESAQTIGGYEYMMEGAVTVNAIPSNYVGSGITQRSSSDLTASGATVTVPSGYYSAQASKSVTSGTAGTPTATKGAVSNHQVTVTPSVTNTAGYISGGTINGTAVTVTASELASGNKAITENGSDIDVVGYSTVSVDVQGGGGSVTQDQDGYIVLPSTGGGSSPVLITKSITANGTYDAEDDDADGYSSVTVNVSGGGGSAQTATGTFTGSGSITQSISCSFAPDLIYVYGDLSVDPSYRGVISIVIIKDEALIAICDGSSSASQQTLWKMSNNITGYNEGNPSGEPYASYSNGTLLFDMVENTSSARFNSSITYSYKLVKWT